MKEKWVSEIEGISTEIVHSEEERKKNIFFNEKYITDL